MKLLYYDKETIDVLTLFIQPNFFMKDPGFRKRK